MHDNGDSLSERKRQILRAVVDAYITGGEPVGSKYLTGEGGIAYSSATIRNEMAELEDLGYLEQPHTSAGRVPSEQGYRFYVDSLMESYRMTAAELTELNKLARLRVAEMDKILARAGRLMSMLTDYTSLTAIARPRATVIRQFRLMRIDELALLLVMVADTSGAASAKTSPIPASGADDDAVSTAERILNERFTGLAAEQITLPLLMEFRRRMGLMDADELAEALISAIYNTLASAEDDGELHIDGVNRLLKYPEYSDPARIGGLLELIDSKETLLDMVKRSDDRGVSVYIGEETSVDSLRGSTVVLKKLRSHGRIMGAVGVIGPCRMKYSKVVTMLDHFAKSLEQLSDEENKNTAPEENDTGADDGGNG